MGFVACRADTVDDTPPGVNRRFVGCENPAVPGLFESAALQLRVAKRLAPRRGASLAERIGRLDDRLVFVVGSPRSGTTFLGDAIGSLPGYLDMGEVAPLKGAVPGLIHLERAAAARSIRKILDRTRRLSLVGTVRPVEQTPEMAFLLDSVPLAYPDARIVHIVRDGRDVACSLLAKGWLRATRTGRDDAGLGFGSYARFWVERERVEEFTTTSDATRAAWAWRRYVTAARTSTAATLEIRYERMATDPASVATLLGAFLDAPEEPLAAALGHAHAESIGRYRSDLSAEELADVHAEAGDLLHELGYLA